MEEEVALKKKRSSTDCVYFLASPLTCKKGSECEYRHSETAWLNPRDCWYWLNRTCRNPVCAFRHPPLEGLAKTVPEPTQPPKVPCYFFLNEYCVKGDQCSFLHEILPSQKFPKAAPATTMVHPPPDNKASSGSDTGPASIEISTNPHVDTSELIKQEHPKVVLQQPAACLSVESEQNMLSPIEYTNGSPQLCEDQVSDEIVKEFAEADECWESSPGLDVLVEDGTEQIAYEEDADYLLAQGKESEMLQRHPLEYLDAKYLCEHGAYDTCDHEDQRCTRENFHRVYEHSSRLSLQSTSDWKWKPYKRRHEEVKGDAVDLRDHLRQRRRTGSILPRCHLYQGRDSNWGRPSGYQMRPLPRNRSHWNDFHVRGWSVHTRSRLREWEDKSGKRKPRPVLPSENFQGSASKTAESSQIRSAGATFSGPKTLEQIKEEKRRTIEEDTSISGIHISWNSRKHGSKDFEGPKPLDELLKHKRRSNGSAVMASVEEHHATGDKELRHFGTLEKESYQYESDFIDDDDDEDTIREKLVHMLSS